MVFLILYLMGSGFFYWINLGQVIGELILGLVLCLWAGLTVPGKFLSILPDSDENR